MKFSLPKIIKVITLIVLPCILIYLVVHLISRSGLRSNNKLPRKELNSTLQAVSNDFRYVHSKDGVDRFILTAKKDTAFSDGRHALEDVQLDGFGEDGKPNGTLVAKTCEYDQQASLAVFKQNVVITTPDELVVTTDEMTYNQADNSASTESAVQFEKKNIKGKCIGVYLDSKSNHFVMNKEVEVTILNQSDNKQKELPPTIIKGSHAEYWKPEKQVFLTGNASLIRGGDELRAERLIAFLNDNQQITKLETRSKSFVKSDEKHGQVESNNMDFFFNDKGDVEKAIAIGNGIAKTFGAEPAREVYGDKLEVYLVSDVSGNVLDKILTNGNARVKFFAPTSLQSSQSIEKEIVANTINVKFFPGGKFTKNADASGNAKLTITPTVTQPSADQKQISAQNMNAVFYENTNQMRLFVANSNVKVDFIPIELNTKRFVRTTQSEKASALFSPDSSDVREIIQEGNFKFNEGVKNATAGKATYVRAQEVIFLREGNPMVWDDRMRTQANQLDLYIGTSENFARGQVRTTYYSPSSAGNATPFEKKSSPIFITSNEAQVNSKIGKAAYMGDARSWQDDNFVRSDLLELFQNEKKMIATGHVSSALYSIERQDEKGTKQIIPMFGTSNKLTYSDLERCAHYEKDTRIVQGSDILTSSNVDIYLQKQSSQVDHIIANENVVIVQPTRRATGNHVEYTAAEDKFVITGNVARVEDKEKGTSTGPRLTFIRSSGSVFAEDKNRIGRIRTKHKIQK